MSSSAAATARSGRASSSRVARLTRSVPDALASSTASWIPRYRAVPWAAKRPLSGLISPRARVAAFAAPWLRAKPAERRRTRQAQVP